MKPLCIAIDGPTGAGKSSLAKALSEALSLMHLDTGAMYRALAVAAFADGINPQDSQAVEAWLPQQTMRLRFIEGKQHSYVNGKDLTPELRQPKISMGASDISKIAAVRRYLVDQQQRLAQRSGFILDGRDIGTVVLKDAPAKLYLTAEPEVRAKRRYEELCEKNLACSYEEILSDLLARDAQDMGREESPLRMAEDALMLDSSSLSLEETFDKALELLASKNIYPVQGATHESH